MKFIVRKEIGSYEDTKLGYNFVRQELVLEALSLWTGSEQSLLMFQQ